MSDLFGWPVDYYFTKDSEIELDLSCDYKLTDVVNKQCMNFLIPIKSSDDKMPDTLETKTLRNNFSTEPKVGDMVFFKDLNVFYRLEQYWFYSDKEYYTILLGKYKQLTVISPR